jgi:hypothetical protein
LRTHYDKFVFWGQWSNPFRSDKDKAKDGLYWSYKEFPVLCFEQTQYFAEVNKAPELIQAHNRS